MDGAAGVARQVGAPRLEGRRILVQLLHQQLAEPAVGERILAGQHLVSDERQGVLVAPAVDLAVTFALFRRHVVRRADHVARYRERLGTERLGEPEVGEHEPARRLLQHHVLRFHVPVNDAVPVRVSESRGRLPQVLQRDIHLQRARLAQDLPEAGPFDERHGEERKPVALVDGEDGYDVRMIQLTRSARLVLEALHDLRVLGEQRRQHLEGDLAIERDLVGEVHACHPSVSDLTEDLELTAGHRP